jgi:hypothetical protein
VAQYESKREMRVDYMPSDLISSIIPTIGGFAHKVNLVMENFVKKISMEYVEKRNIKY